MNLFELVRNNDIEGVKTAIANGVDVNTRDKFGWAALMLASYKRHTEIAKLLLDAGADIEARSDDWGNTALMIASCWRRTEIVKLLIERGADVNVRDKKGETPLMIAASRRGHPEIEELLIDAGAKK